MHISSHVHSNIERNPGLYQCLPYRIPSQFRYYCLQFEAISESGHFTMYDLACDWFLYHDMVVTLNDYTKVVVSNTFLGS